MPWRLPNKLIMHIYLNDGFDFNFEALAFLLFCCLFTRCDDKWGKQNNTSAGPSQSALSSWLTHLFGMWAHNLVFFFTLVDLHPGGSPIQQHRLNQHLNFQIWEAGWHCLLPQDWRQGRLRPGIRWWRRYLILGYWPSNWLFIWHLPCLSLWCIC